MSLIKRTFLLPIVIIFAAGCSHSGVGPSGVNRKISSVESTTCSFDIVSVKSESPDAVLVEVVSKGVAWTAPDRYQFYNNLDVKLENRKIVVQPKSDPRRLCADRPELTPTNQIVSSREVIYLSTIDIALLANKEERTALDSIYTDLSEKLKPRTLFPAFEVEFKSSKGSGLPNLSGTKIMSSALYVVDKFQSLTSPFVDQNDEVARKVKLEVVQTSMSTKIVTVIGSAENDSGGGGNNPFLLIQAIISGNIDESRKAVINTELRKISDLSSVPGWRMMTGP